jgi:hypothetical protein
MQTLFSVRLGNHSSESEGFVAIQNFDSVWVGLYCSFKIVFTNVSMLCINCIDAMDCKIVNC